jgi:hypothetical protein
MAGAYHRRQEAKAGVCGYNGRMRAAVALTLATLLGWGVAAPAGANEMEMLFGGKSKPFIDPQGFYAVVFPSGFDCKAMARNVECTGRRQGQARLVVRVVDTPPSATTELVLMNELDQFKKKPHFKLVDKTHLTVDGSPAMAAVFTYDYMGNVEYTVGVQALYLVRQTKTYVIHFESHVGNFPTYKKDLEALYATFKPARLDPAGNPILEDLKPQKSDDPDNLPDVNKALKGGY